jgi:hypothetical protein
MSTLLNVTKYFSSQMKRNAADGLPMKLKFFLWKHHLVETVSWLKAAPTMATLHYL